jgi:single-strand DNA-binding protein
LYANFISRTFHKENTMASLNKVMIIGNLGRDPEVRYTADGAAIANISLATTSSWKDKNSGEKKEETEWHRVVFYNKLAEIVGQYAKKGRPLYVEGRLKTRKWTDKDGVEKYTTEIVADQMQLLGGREGMGDPEGRGGDDGMNQTYSAPPNPGAGNRGAGAYASGASNQAAPARRPAPASSAMDDDDIPF